MCTCAGRGSGLAIVTQTRGSIDPSYLRGSRTEGREQGSATSYLPLRQVATCKTATGVWPSKHEQLTRPAPSPRDQLGKKLHALPCTDFSPTEAFLHKPMFRKLTYIRIFLQSLYDRKYIVTCRCSLSTDCCAKITNTFLPLITSTIGLT